ncbi:multi-sensor signal transduction histidine kinase [Paenibacillus sp. FSL R7-277]|uniref:cache domain-containing sensor histidine kinase n=1 Tax=unclassified Paenibacillus TaxID=185978 RepID=UPI0003E23555|nr:sensor histidine kinase [Paenibacillus sp. FSL R7-277]ETT63661.1 multi-sensor signal transduction histidine kinase [Paenibacillus sp. FSL R7-277]
MRITRWISSSLRAKLLALFIVLSTIPLIAVGLISYQKSYQSISSHSKASSMLQAEMLGTNMDNLFKDTERLLELSNNPQVIHFLFSQSETYQEAKDILQTFTLYRDTYKYENVLNISLINLYGKGISERRGIFQSASNPLRNPHFQALSQNPELILRVPPPLITGYDRVDGFTYGDEGVISIMTAVKQRITHEVIGYIIVDLSDSFIKEFCDKVTIGTTGFFYLLDEQNNPLYVPPVRAGELAVIQDNLIPAGERGRSGSFVLQMGGPPRFIVHTSSLATGWTIIGIAPLQEIVAEANRIRQLIIISVALSIIFAITLHYLLTRRLTRPIQLLQHKMRLTASGYLEAKVKPDGTDEIADLGQSFNIMVEQIKELLAQSIRKQQQLQKAELRTLQAQINPHFLYNTLDSIVWMAEAGNHDGVIRLVKALSAFFRLSLNNGRDWIQIRSELAHVQSYLIIQQMRYHDILEFKVEVAEELQEYPILNMTLQPLVENALYHGIKNKRGMGLIRIGGYTDGGTIMLTVSDNGIGIPAGRLEALRESVEHPIQSEEPEDTGQGGFGLQNVHQRLRLYFGPEYGIRLDSSEGYGTQITVRIPKNRGV